MVPQRRRSLAAQLAARDAATGRPLRGKPSPRLADLNGDGKPDLVVGDDGGAIHFLWNQGTPGLADLRENPSSSIAVSACYWVQPALADADGDGDPDLFVAGLDAVTLSSGRLFYIENRGTPAAPAWAPETDWLDLTTALGVDAFSFPSVAAGDVNGDGLVDLVLDDGQGTTYLARCLHGPPGFVFAPLVVLDASPTKPSSARLSATSTVTAARIWSSEV